MSRDALCRQLGYVFKQPQLLQRALTHRSHSQAHYERLEFLGDSVLNCIIAKHLYEAYPELPEGDMSRLRSNLVNQQTLSILAQQLHLGELLLMGEGERKSAGFRRPSILADAMEADADNLARLESEDVGKPIAVSAADIPFTPDPPALGAGIEGASYSQNIVTTGGITPLTSCTAAVTDNAMTPVTLASLGLQLTPSGSTCILDDTGTGIAAGASTGSPYSVVVSVMDTASTSTARSTMGQNRDSLGASRIASATRSGSTVALTVLASS